MKAVNNPILKPCPFCGSPVRRIRGFAGLNFFKCTNFDKCGAVMSFDNDYYNSNPEQAYKAYNSRAEERIAENSEEKDCDNCAFYNEDRGDQPCCYCVELCCWEKGEDDGT